MTIIFESLLDSMPDKHSFGWRELFVTAEEKSKGCADYDCKNAICLKCIPGYYLVSH
jgi:hypothetical protein